MILSTINILSSSGTAVIANFKVNNENVNNIKFVHNLSDMDRT